MVKKISLLGATGSIGVQTIDVCMQHPEQFEIVSFAFGNNVSKAIEIIEQCPSVQLVSASKAEHAMLLKEKYPHIRFVYGDDGLNEVATFNEATTIVNALVGFVGLIPTLKAIEMKKEIALANKETLVVAGEIVCAKAKEANVSLIPIDSEHSAIYQCLLGKKKEEVRRLIITASGGSFRNYTRDQLKDVSVEQALNHPNWKMGAKITIDSATMMNKGFEVIEAHWLFDIDYDKIDVIIHPESIIHSMVEFKDHAILAQLGTADMRLPIQYALSGPTRYDLNDESLDFARLKQLTFKEADTTRYPLLALAYEALKKKGNFAACMNGANDTANELFREGKISFLQIEELVIEACNKLEYKKEVTLQDCLDAHAWGKNYVLERVNSLWV